MMDTATWTTWAEMEADLAHQQKKDDLAKAEWERNSEELRTIRATQALITKAEDRLAEKNYREKIYGVKQDKGNDKDSYDEWLFAWRKYVKGW